MECAWQNFLRAVNIASAKFAFQQLSRIANHKDIDFSEDKFTTLRFVDENEKFTNLAYLLRDENPLIVKFAVYKNKNMEFAVKKEFSGSWVAMLDQVLEYVNLFNDTSAKVIGSDATLTTKQSYPDPALREIVVNAFAHFDATFPSDIKIEFYPDRAEIASPGALYRTSMNEVVKGRQSFRNPNLVYVLNKFGYIENYATGLKKTTEAYSEFAQKPIYESTEHFFIVTLPNVNFKNEEQNDKVNDKVKLKEKTQDVLGLIKANPQITREQIANQLNVSESTINRAVKELKDNGFIGEKEVAKTGSWKILK